MEGQDEPEMIQDSTIENKSELVCAATNASDNDEDVEDIQLSLAQLPDVILVKILKFLNLKERYYLSITCHRLNELFPHPDLWKVAHIHLLEVGVVKNRSRWASTSIMRKTMSEIVKRFSHLFQHLHLQTTGVIKPFEPSFVDMLKDLANECRLESLTLTVGVLESKDEEIQFERNFYSDTKHVHYITALLKNALRLKHLNIRSWPLRKDTKENGIFQTIISNEKLNSLESIGLFNIDKKEQWTGRVPNLPTPELVTEVFSFLSNLTHIALRSPMLDDSVIQLLASENRKSLKKLEVLIMWSRPTAAHDGCKIPDISDQSWKQLKRASPNVEIGFLVHLRIPFDELIVMFKPDVPLTSVMILKYGQCGSTLIDSITSKYASTLKSFVSLCDSDGCDSSLSNLMKECANLGHLVYHGDVNYKTIMQMADIAKETEREMKSFEFNERNVKTDNLNEGTEDDEIVIRQDNETLEYVIAPIQAWHYDEELHSRKVDMMVNHVKNIFGNTWAVHRK